VALVPAGAAIAPGRFRLAIQEEWAALRQ
jgi:hypothetical protein